MKCQAWFDASVRTQTRQSTVGFYAKNENNKIIFENNYKIHYIQSTTKAEYIALILLLRALCLHEIKNVQIYGDNRIVIEQINQQAKCKGKYLYYLEQCQQLMKYFQKCELLWIPRKENQYADKLTKEAIYKEREDGALQSILRKIKKKKYKGRLNN